MDPIYNFEAYAPPIVTESTLCARRQRRRQRWCMALLAVAGVLLQAAILVLGWATAQIYPIALLGSVAYVLVSAAGGAAIAILYVQKGGEKACL